MNKRQGVLLILSILLTGCSVSGKYRGDGPCKGFHKEPQSCERAYENSLVIGKIKIGQSTADVRAIMGRDPERRNATAESETWSYLTDYSGSILTAIVFKNDAVVEIKQTSTL